MQPKLENSVEKSFQYWLYIKISFASFWLFAVSVMFVNADGCPYPLGICRLCSFNALFTPIGKWVTLVVILTLITLYLLEKAMLWTTSSLALLSCIIITHHESNGLYYHTTPLTAIWAVQFIAYLLPKVNPGFDYRFYRQQFGIQIIAAIYVLSAIAKLRASGISWVLSGASFMQLQIIKGFSFAYFDTGKTALLQKGYLLANMMAGQKKLMIALLSISLLLEFFCFIAVFNRGLRYAIAFALILMHTWIFYCMDLIVPGIVVPMIIFFINPLFWFGQIFRNKAALKT